MRLINLSTYELEEHDDYALPKYAILSHRWEDEEVLFAHWKDVNRWRSAEPGSRPKGWRKLLSFCDVARDQHGLNYGWADTVAIDKSSSAELTQAINSMYRYYKESAICIAYLSDVLGDCPRFSEPNASSSATKVCLSRWFTRGWTLQELIAPSTLVFYSAQWKQLGVLRDSELMITLICCTTRIPRGVLQGKNEPKEFAVGARMSWAARRVTARPEDRAYCLLGIFEVNMPLIYGEGKRAFLRLQEEIVRRSTDHTIFAWNKMHALPRSSRLNHELDGPSNSLFAFSADNFAHDLIIWQCYRDLEGWVESYEVTNYGLEISLPLIKCRSSRENVYHAVLNCRMAGGRGPVALNVKKVERSYRVQEEHVTIRPILQPCFMGPNIDGNCTAVHDGRLALVNEEDLMLVEKSQVTIPRKLVRHIPSAPDEASRRVLFGFASREQQRAFIRQDRLPPDVWIGESSVWKTYKSWRAGISFTTTTSRSIAILLFSPHLPDLEIGIAVVEMGPGGEHTLQSALASRRVYDGRQQVGAGCAVAFPVNTMERTLVFRLEVVHSMGIDFFILTAALEKPRATQTSGTGQHMRRDHLDILAVCHDRDRESLAGDLRHSVRRGENLPRPDPAQNQHSGNCDGIPPHNHVRIEREAGHALIEEISHSVYTAHVSSNLNEEYLMSYR
ncbi:hypothetical protein LTR17_008687 [Elasticomyces elasticus]|nr:hypothetical protein LTR17_008687 [Elasticomyces elasticus]